MLTFPYLPLTPPKHILVAPLDWGLGHATRCVPLIRELKKRKCYVVIASSGRALTLLRQEFPTLPWYKLPAYQVRYSNGFLLVFKLFLQLPKFIITIYNERRHIRTLVEEQGIEIIISDHRYGCYAPSPVTSVLLIHQLNILMPRWLNLLTPLVNSLHHHLIDPFQHYWIPCDKRVDITGKMTKTHRFNTISIGLLSRFTKRPHRVFWKWDIIAVLSGPEPQRTIFEKKILDQLSLLNLSSLVIRGIPEGRLVKRENRTLLVDHLSSSALQFSIEHAKIVLCRPGYSTIMDLITLCKKAIVVPTPGQTEQMYLACKLKDVGLVYFQHQHCFDLEEALKKSIYYKGFEDYEPSPYLLAEALNPLVQ